MENQKNQPNFNEQELREKVSDIRNEIITTLKQMQVDVDLKMINLSEKIDKKCEKKSGEKSDKQNLLFQQCKQKETQKLDAESQIFNNKLFKAQEKAFVCFLKALKQNENYSSCNQIFIKDIDEGIKNFFDEAESRIN